ncbi:hypothetical protein BH09ACT12_BH09ACT12_10980 [soil metagenome]
MSVRSMVISCVVGVSLGAGGVGLGAWAASTSGDVVARAITSSSVHTCVAKKGGAVHVAARCSKKERALTLPVGADLARAWQAAIPGYITLTATATAVATLRLPAGNYRLDYALTFANDHDSAGGRCALVVDDESVSSTQTTADVEPGGSEVLASSALVELKSSASAEVVCTSVYHDGGVGMGHLEAIRVGVVNGAWSPTG